MYNQIAELTGVEADTEIAAGAQPISYAIAARVELPADEKQRMLELRSERARLGVVTETVAARTRPDRLGRPAIQRLAQTNGKSSLHR